MNASNYMMYNDAERTAAAILLDQTRALEYPPSTFERRMRFERAVTSANRQRETVDEEMKKTRATWAKERYDRATMTRFWIARHTTILTRKASAVVDHKAFVKWLKQIDKLIPTQKARGEVGAWMKEAQYKTVTLDLVNGKLSATYYAAINGQWGWVTAVTRLDCGIHAGTFTVTVDFDTLRELVNTLDDGALILHKDRDVTPLMIEQGRSKTRLKHTEIGDKFEWMR
jgi:hypothetical protein